MGFNLQHIDSRHSDIGRHGPNYKKDAPDESPDDCLFFQLDNLCGIQAIKAFFENFNQKK